MRAMDGPFLKSAVFCERVLREKDDTPSAIRIYDRASVELSAPPGTDGKGIPVRLEPWMLLSFVRGKASSSHKAGLRMFAPSGKPLGKVQNYPFTFGGDGVEEATVNIVFQMAIDAKEDGVYWMHVSLDDTPVTRVPLRVERMVTPQK